MLGRAGFRFFGVSVIRTRTYLTGIKSAASARYIPRICSWTRHSTFSPNASCMFSERPDGTEVHRVRSETVFGSKWGLKLALENL